jgi:glycosyltransferase involved in cell wall biosynthesis
LKRLLYSLNQLVRDTRFNIEIIIVDNDAEKSCESIALEFQCDSGIPLRYYHEKRQNISYARNMSVLNSTGNFIAFIDDDEFPEKTWLTELYSALLKFKADGVLGPVDPHFETNPPKWIIKSGVCERKKFKTGYHIKNHKFTRTGNALLSRNIFFNIEEPFNPKYGIIGGGDADFFKRMIEKGFKFVYCNEATVYETVIPLRYKRSYYIKRAFTRGATSTYNSFFSFNTIKSIIAIGIYTPILLLTILFNHSYFMKYFIKTCDHIGKLLAYAGIKIVDKRPY